MCAGSAGHGESGASASARRAARRKVGVLRVVVVVQQVQRAR
jgi:hypothetical protein